MIMDDLTSDKKTEDAAKDALADEVTDSPAESAIDAEFPQQEGAEPGAAAVVEAEDGVLEADFGDAGDSEAAPEHIEPEAGLVEGELADSQVDAEPELGPAVEGDSESAAPVAEGSDEPPIEPAAAAGVAAKPANLRWDLLFWLLLICVSLLRLGYLYIVPLDLGPDESYYWDWSRRLDLGYYSKPPMIAWVNALSTKLLGVTPEAVRIPAVLFGALGLVGMYLCGRRMFNAEVGFWGVVAWLATPGAAALGLLMTTDALLVSCWCLALYTLWRTIDATRGRFLWGFLTMLLVGTGSLSTQLMLVFPLLMFLYLLLSADRRQLARRWPWLLWVGSLLFLLPPLYWNFNQGWITIKHTANFVTLAGSGWQDYLKTFGEFVGWQLALLTPLTWLLLLLLLVSLLPKFLRWSRQTRYLVCFSAFGLLAFAGFSFQQGINPSGSAVFYPAGLLLLAAWGRQQIHGGMLNRLHRLFIPGLKLGLALTLLAYLLPFILQLSFIPLGKKDPTRQVKGWSELGQQVGGFLQEQPRPEATLVLSPLRKYSSALAFYAPGNPLTYKWPGNPPKVSSQYELWPGPIDKLGWDALILHDADNPLPEELVAVFENVVDLGEQSIPIGAAGKRKYHLWRGENLQSWPE